MQNAECREGFALTHTPDGEVIGKSEEVRGSGGFHPHPIIIGVDGVHP